MLTQRSLAVTAGLVTLLSLRTEAWGQEGGPGPYRVDLHVGKAYEECYFDLHPELTGSQLREFAGEGGQVIRSRQLSSAETLGAGVLDISLGYALFFLDDAKGAWNNTMSHPAPDHYLGQQLGMPHLALRLGVTDEADAELSGSANWMSNYGFVGLATKIRVLREGDRMPVSVSVRPSVTALVGPSELHVLNVSADVAVSHNFYGFMPFAGVTGSSTLVVETSSDTDVGNQVASRPLAFVGLEYRWKAINAAAQAEISDLPAVALRVGGSF